jgi:hypothetical protein
MSSSSRMLPSTLLTNQPSTTNLTLQIKRRRIRKLLLLPQLPRQLQRPVENRRVRDGEDGRVEVERCVGYWGEGDGVVMDSGVEEDGSGRLGWVEDAMGVS